MDIVLNLFLNLTSVFIPFVILRLFFNWVIDGAEIINTV